MKIKASKLYEQEDEYTAKEGGLNTMEDPSEEDLRDLDLQQDLTSINNHLANSTRAQKRRERSQILAERKPEGRDQTASQADVQKAQQQALGSLQESIPNEGQSSFSRRRFAERLSKMAAKKMPIERIGGKNLPKARFLRNPLMDKMPIEGEELGLSPKDFLLKRKITARDWQSQMDLPGSSMLGANLDNIHELNQIFERGKSSIHSPKLDLAPSLRNNPVQQRQLLAEQLLRNLNTGDPQKDHNSQTILLDLGLSTEDLEAIKEDQNAQTKAEWIEKLSHLLPK